MARATQSFGFDGLTGSVGNVTIVRSDAGMVVRARTIPRNPRSPAQRAVRARLAAVARCWEGMTIEQAWAWRDYARLHEQLTGVRRSGQLLFNSLAIRFLLVNPNGVIPLLPPSSAFSGDSVTFTAAMDGPSIVVSASGSNAPDVVTEFLIQPLRSVHRRTYRERYRTAAVHAFVAGEPLVLPAPARVTAVAIRLIRTSTGQAGNLVEIGVFQS